VAGAYQWEEVGEVIVVFLFAPGETPGIDGMTPAQTVELAETLAILHDASGALPFAAPRLDEDISLAFCHQLAHFLRTGGIGESAVDSALLDLISPHRELLLAAARKALRLRDEVRAGLTPLVLCHGDAHGNNVIQGNTPQGGRLVLADWEGLCMAPPEADLFIHAWHPFGDALLESYAAARSGYKINNEMLHFYVLRRRIEDVWADVQRLTQEGPDEAEAAELLRWIGYGIGKIKSLVF
jgi:aminoglycoside phosphotransferase (APT) family kinase protein